MRIIGLITLGGAAVAALGAALVAIISIPDIKHYRRIRNM